MSGSLLLPLGIWVPIVDGDAHASAMYERHYSSAKSIAQRRERGTLLIAGPGFKLVLSTPCRRALLVWRKFRSMDDQTGVSCAIFRNEGAGLSSDLIRAADAIADARWPGERHYTYVNPRKVVSAHPGFCFLKAGWRYVRDQHGRPARTKSRGLLILEREARIIERIAAWPTR